MKQSATDYLKQQRAETKRGTDYQHVGFPYLCHCGVRAVFMQNLCRSHLNKERLLKRNKEIIADRKRGIPWRELELKYEITRQRMHVIIKRGG